MEKILNDFRQEVINIYATFKITTVGLSLLKSEYGKALRLNPELDQFIIQDDEMGYEIKISRESFEVDNSEYGEFNIILASVFLSSIYQLWEDKFRQLIADKLNVDKNKVKNDLIGEIRRLRQAIVHNQFLPTKELKSLKILSFIIINDKLNISSKEMSKIIILLTDELEEMKKEYCS